VSAFHRLRIPPFINRIGRTSRPRFHHHEAIMKRLTTLLLSALLALAAFGVQAAALTDYAENKTVDAILRGQSLGAPATWYAALYTTCPTDASAGTEVSGGSYARVAVTASLANWAGTQAAGSTAASSGTNGTSSNNGTVAFPAPTANWGVVQCWGLLDAASSGNLWIYSVLGTAKTINNGDAAPYFPAGAATFQIDN
jgi:hypothetical protein